MSNQYLEAITEILQQHGISNEMLALDLAIKVMQMQRDEIAELATV